VKGRSDGLDSHNLSSLGGKKINSRKSHGNPLDPKQIVSYEELLVSQVVQQEALTRLLIEKGIFTKEEFLQMVEAVNRGMKRISK